MTNALWRQCIGLAIAATAAIGLTVGVAGTAMADNALHMHIENESKVTLYYKTGVSAVDYPATIAAGTTSEGIKGPHSGGGGDGQITYMNASSPSAATCTFTLGYGYKYNGTTDHCDDKTFTITLTPATGVCTLVKDGNCEGAGSCDCKFKYTQP